MNNPLQMMQMMKNPQALMQSLMGNNEFMQNPICQNALTMYRNGDKKGMNELIDNLCKEKGVSRQEIEKQIRSQFGM